MKTSFHVESSSNADLNLKLMLNMGGGRHEPWGLLRLPISDIIKRGSHQGWFFLSDVAGDPLREKSEI
jgi:hypothetical protein